MRREKIAVPCRLAPAERAGYHADVTVDWRYALGGMVSVVDFANILKIFGGSEPSDAEKKELFKEATLMVLARATSADTNIKKVEVSQVQALMLEATGEEVSAGGVQTAASSQLFESQPLEKYLGSVSRKLDNDDRVKIIQLLAKVVQSDDRVSYMEVDYFNLVCGALGATPADVLGLVAAEY